ncbi:MAG: AbiJ-NTD4 domain-containing protein [Thalassobaculum sp.]
MIADVFYDRNPGAFNGINDDRYARVFHQISSVIFEGGLRHVYNRRERCKVCYEILSRELGVNELMKRVIGNVYMPTVIDHETACQIFIGQMEHPGFRKQSTGEFYRQKLSLAELLLRGIEIPLQKAGKGAFAARLLTELNERLRRAQFPYRFHAGVFQLADDDLSEAELETPFWTAISDPMWKSVDDEMKDAFDTRANNGVDPAFQAAKALESTIKIVSDHKGWTSGTEKGAANYIDNLVSQKNGRFLEVWEGDLLKLFFAKVRNPMGHGAGNQTDPKMNSHHTDWVIDQSMAWIKSITRRL